LAARFDAHRVRWEIEVFAMMTASPKLQLKNSVSASAIPSRQTKNLYASNAAREYNGLAARGQSEAGRESKPQTEDRRMSELKAKEYKRFEDIRITRADGSEYWPARELAPVLEYVQWRNFTKVLDRAMLACRNSGFEIADHFAEVSKMVDIGSGTKRRVKDYELTRYACYLIVQNGDPRKEVIALGQTYFAIQTYRQEIADRFNLLDEDNKRLVIRGDVRQWNQMLAEAARDASVITNEKFAVF
jgi:hypothetical protein